MSNKSLKMGVVAPIVAVLVALGAMVPTAAFAASCTSPAAYTTITAVATLSSMHWLSVPSTGPGGCTYSTIRVIGYARAKETTVCDTEMALRLGSAGNGTVDTGSDYLWTEARLNGATLAQTGPGVTNQAKIAVLTCDLETSSESSVFEIIMPNAFQTTYSKQVMAHSAVESDETGVDPYGVTTGEFSASWSGTGAVTDVQLFPYISGNGGGFVTGSSATLYVE